MNNLAFLNNQSFPNHEIDESSTSQYSQLKTHYDSKNKIGWFMMNASPRPCFTIQLLNDIRSYINSVKAEMLETGGQMYDFLVVGSNVNGVFNLGGDLDLFKNLIRNHDRDGLLAYARSCIDILYQNFCHFDLDVTTISLIQGDALGGGFEAALSSNIVIAERGVKLGLPEVLFNLFPGMGAYTLLSRKANPVVAERMILSGKLYLAEELFDMGIIDIIAEKGEGELALYKYVKSSSRARNSYSAMRKVNDICNQISYEELDKIANVWADAALNLEQRDIKTMDRLINRQTKKSEYRN